MTLVPSLVIHDQKMIRVTGTLVFTDAIDGDSAPSYTITSESSNGTASIDATTGHGRTYQTPTSTAQIPLL